MCVCVCVCVCACVIAVGRTCGDEAEVWWNRVRAFFLLVFLVFLECQIFVDDVSLRQKRENGLGYVRHARFI